MLHLRCQSSHFYVKNCLIKPTTFLHKRKNKLIIEVHKLAQNIIQIQHKPQNSKLVCRMQQVLTNFISLHSWDKQKQNLSAEIQVTIVQNPMLLRACSFQRQRCEKLISRTFLWIPITSRIYMTRIVVFRKSVFTDLIPSSSQDLDTDVLPHTNNIKSYTIITSLTVTMLCIYVSIQ